MKDSNQSIVLRYAQSYKALLIFLIFTFFFFQNIPCRANITTGLVGWWKLTDGGGSSAADSSGNGQTATLHNNPSWVAGKVWPNALSFNGTNQAGQASINLSADSVITISFWMYKSSFANDDQLAFEFTANQNFNAGAFIVDPDNSGGCSSGTFSFGSGSGSSTLWQFSFTRPSTGKWHQYVFVIYYDASVGTDVAYVDGSSVNLTAGTGFCAGSFAGNFANSTLNFASRNNSTLYLNGKLEDVRIYNRVLSASDVAQLYGAETKHFAHVHLANFHTNYY